MKKKTKVRAYTGATLLSFLGLTWLTTSLVTFSSGMRNIFVVVMVVLGLGAALLVFRLLSRSVPKGASAARPSLGKDVDLLWNQAKKRLADSKVTQADITRCPVVLLIGPAGSTKTTLVERCGLDAEHLAGALYRGEEVAPTELLNIWYGPDGTVFVEAGVAVVEDPEAWGRLARLLRPRRLSAVFGRGRQAPRAAVVCFSTEDLYDSSESLAKARDLREKLSGLATRLGIRLPVYAVFTKVDTVPYFREYVRNLKQSEGAEILGSTLPLLPSFGPNLADVEADRILAAYEALMSSLGLHRVKFLKREEDDVRKADVYEFPRELSKLRDAISDFLLQLCRPSRLAVSPFLRGFYFTGVRPVTVSDAPAASTPEIAGDRLVADASRIFDPSKDSFDVQPTLAAGTRRVPEWVFARSLFRKILSGDEVAREVTGGGAQVNLLRRIALLSVTGVAAFFVIGMTTSFFRNRALVRDVRAAVNGVEPLAASGGGAVTTDDLAALETLRGYVDRLRTWDVEGRPVSYGFGLYKGRAIFDDAWLSYFASFEPNMGGPARRNIAAYLAGLSGEASRGATPGESYNVLRAYVQLTMSPDSAADGDLPAVMLDYWGQAAGDSTRLVLSSRQFEFLASELPRRPPERPRDLASREDQALVTSARLYQQQFNQPDYLYDYMLAQAAGGAPPIAFARSPVVAGGTVAAHFSGEAWAYVQRSLQSLNLTGKPYVVGSDARVPDLAPLAEGFRTRYQDEFVAAWVDFIQSAAIQGAGSARTVEALQRGGSPLVEFLALVSSNTAVGLPQVDQIFQPAHLVMPLDSAGSPQRNNAMIQPYLAALAGLVAPLQASERETNALARAQLRAQEVPAAQAVRQAVDNLSRAFDRTGTAVAVGEGIARLLNTPYRVVNSREQGAGAQAKLDVLNGLGQQFCTDLGAVTAKYPFTPSSTRATPQELDAVLKPGQGLVGALVQKLAGEHQFIQETPGGGYRAVADESPYPTPELLRFLARARALSNALYAGGAEPSAAFSLRMVIPSGRVIGVSVNIDGTPADYSETSDQAAFFRWSPATARSASFNTRVRGTPPVSWQESGTWAIQLLFEKSDPRSWQLLPSGAYDVRWPLATQDTIIGLVSMLGGASADVLRTSAYASLTSCFSVTATRSP